MLGVDYREQVGEWIAIRRDELGYSGRQLADLLGVDAKTVSNYETGRTAVRQKSRLEDVFRWKRGSLTAAYRRGEKPEVLAESGEAGDVIDKALDAAEVPAEFREVARRQLLAWRAQDRGTMGDRKIG